MQIIRIYSDSCGESHFDEYTLELNNNGQIGFLSDKIAATGVIFRTTPPDYNFDWHNAPQRQFILMLEGGVEIEVSDGEKRTFNTGDVILVEDTTGKGHVSKAINNQARKSVFITLD